MALINTPYDNFFLENEVEDTYKSHLDLQQFCKIDNSLVANAGDTVEIHKYTATDGAEELRPGEANTKFIKVSYADNLYGVRTVQTTFKYLDEELAKDPMIPVKGADQEGADLFNFTMKDVYTEMGKATLSVTLSGSDYFAAFVDAMALLNYESLDGGASQLYAIVSPADLAAVRKSMKDELKYVSDIAVTGYVGSVAGCNLFVKKDATAGQIVLGARDAITVFNKSGVVVEQSRDIETRTNTQVARKVYVAALTDATKIALIKKGA